MVFEDKAFAGDKVVAGGDEVVKEDGIRAEGLVVIYPTIIVHEVIDSRAVVFVAFVRGCVVVAADDCLADIGVGRAGQAEDL